MIIRQFKKEEDNEVLQILVDEDPHSPREWDNVGVIATWHRRYTLGDERPDIDPQEYMDDLPEGTVVLPVYMYDHSGLALSTAPFSCPWDSGQLGIIYATPDKIKETGVNPEHVEEVLRGEIETYGQYISGEVYGFRRLRRTVCESCGQTVEEELDSCWGFFGTDWIENGIVEHVGFDFTEWEELNE